MPSDLLVSVNRDRPGSSDTALRWVREALQASFPSTPIRVSRPAVIVDFAGGAETWEVTPGFITGRGGEGEFVYDIPGRATEWIDTAPLVHIAYVNECNQKPGVVGGAKKLARLMKAWRYYNNVPISSFYLEMRAAQHVAGETAFVPVHDVSQLLNKLNGHQLAAMNDPQGTSGRIFACATTTQREEALSKLSTAAARASLALDAHVKGDIDTAFAYLDRLFGGRFPAR